MNKHQEQGPSIKAECSSNFSIKQEHPDDSTATYGIVKTEENLESNDQPMDESKPNLLEPDLGESANISLHNTGAGNISAPDHEVWAKSSFTNFTEHVSHEPEQKNAWSISINSGEVREDIQVMLNDDQDVSHIETQDMIHDINIKTEPESSEPESSDSHIQSNTSANQDCEVLCTTVKSDYVEIERFLTQQVSFPASQNSSASFAPILLSVHAVRSKNPDSMDTTLVQSKVTSVPASLSALAPLASLPSSSKSKEQSAESDPDKFIKSTVINDAKDKRVKNISAVPLKHVEGDEQTPKTSSKTMEMTCNVVAKYKCENCKKTFPTMSVLKLHQQLFHEPKESHQKKPEPVSDKRTRIIPSDFKCEFCGEKHKGAKNYFLHRKSHVLQCKFCDKTFSPCHKSNFIIHMRSHTGEKPYICDICGIRFVSNGGLVSHRKRHDPDNAKKFQCQICGKFYPDQHGFQRHIKTHSGIKPFDCKVCGKHFTQAGSVKLHMRMHADTEEDRKPFQCIICNKRLAHAASLRSHLKTHEKVDS